MIDLIDTFIPYCDDSTALVRLKEITANRGEMMKAHGLFSNEIRPKTLRAEKRRDEKAQAQYLFEEACAKTLYNLTRSSAPFDPDAPFWILPNAIAFGRYLGIERPGELSPLLKM